MRASVYLIFTEEGSGIGNLNELDIKNYSVHTAHERPEILTEDETYVMEWSKIHFTIYTVASRLTTYNTNHFFHR